MPVPLQRSVFIGLGGTGQLAILHLKKRLLEVYGEVPPVFSLLCFDTDFANPLVDEHRQSVALSAGEFKWLQIKSLSPLLHSTEVTPWCSTQAGTTATGRNRLWGRQAARLALFANASEVRDRIRYALARVCELQVSAPSTPYHVTGDGIAVHIVASVAGSAGAGLFLDVGMLSRSMLTSMDTVTAHLVLPEVFMGLPGVFGADRTAYACLQEIDLLMGMRTGDDYSYMMGGHTVPVQEPPFDMVHLLGTGHVVEPCRIEAGEIAKCIGVELFLEGAAVSASITDSLRCFSPDDWEGRQLNYSSYGVSEILFDRRRLADLYAKRIALQLSSGLSDACASASDAAATLRTEIERIRVGRTRRDPFTVLLEPPAAFDREVAASSSEFFAWISDTQQITVAELGDLGPGDLIDLLTTYAAQQPLVTDTLSMTVTDALSLLEDAEREDCLKQLLVAGAPLWDYERGYVSGCRGTETVRAVAFPDQNSPSFDEQARRAAGLSDRAFLMSTGDSERASVWTVEALLPAFVIGNVASYRDAYLAADPKSRERLHLDRTWVKDLVDLMPRHSNEMSSRWAVACAMHAIKGDTKIPYGAVNKRGNVYYFVTKNAPPEKNHEIKLGQGRLTAYEVFMDTPEYVDEVEQQLQEELQCRGAHEVADAITAYAVEFEAGYAAMPTGNAEVLALLQQESRDLAILVEDILNTQ